MINSLPNRSSISPFRKSVNFSSTTLDTGNNDLAEATNKQYSKRQSLNIVTGNNTDNHIISRNASPNSSISSPSKVRQRLSSLFRSSSPVVTTLKGTFSHNSSSHNLSSTNKRGSQSTVSYSAITEQAEKLDEQQPPTLIEPLEDNHSTTTLSSSSDASDHMPASPTDGASANSFNQSRKDIMDPSFWNPTSTRSIHMASLTYHHTAPPTPPPHQVPSIHSPTSLAVQVQKILGNTLDEIDDEIDLDWEHSRNVLRQSLISPQTCERIKF